MPAGTSFAPRTIRCLYWAAMSLAFWVSDGARAEALQLREIAQGVFVHQGVSEVPDTHNKGEIANIGFIVGGQCVAVIDSGGSPQQGHELRAAIKRLTTTPICFVINSHVHPDHIYGNRAFLEPGVRFVGHHKLARAMASRAGFYIDKAERDLGIGLTPEDFVMPELEVRDHLDLDLGGRKITLTAHPAAHTDNDLSVYDHATQTLWLADLLFMEHLPVIDGSLNGWLKVLAQLRLVNARRAVPGHGPVAAYWPADSAPLQNYLQSLQSEIRGALRNGITIERAMMTVGQNLRGQWKLFDDFHKRNIATAYAELEWEED